MGKDILSGKQALFGHHLIFDFANLVTDFIGKKHLFRLENSDLSSDEIK